MTTLPNLLVAGAQKSGTTWLHSQLSHHPDVFMSAKKELNFFNTPANRGDADAWAAYARNFADAGDVRYRGESTPHYFWKRVAGAPYSPPPLDPDPAEFVRELLGHDLTVLVLLRDPVSRAVSAYHHNNSRNRTRGRSLFDCPTTMGLVDIGFYSRHWQHWVEVIGRERLSVHLYDDLAADPPGLLRAVLERLDLADVPEFWAAARPGKKVHRRKQAETPAVVTPQEIAELHAIYAREIDFVEELTGRDLPAWRDLDRLVETLESS